MAASKSRIRLRLIQTVVAAWQNFGDMVTDTETIKMLKPTATAYRCFAERRSLKVRPN
jgi:hypothetical protein